MPETIQELPVLPGDPEKPERRKQGPAAYLSPPPEMCASVGATLSDGKEAEQVPTQRRVYFEVFGCQMNKLDAELMMSVLYDEGYRLTPKIEDAGVVLYNTCAIREQAENRVFSKIGSIKSLKKQRPDLVIGVLGCSAQNHQKTIFQRHPHVGIVCGPGEFMRLPELITSARRHGQVAALDLDVTPPAHRRRNLGPLQHQAYVSVMRGCDQACTFCVVPSTRGKEVSRPVREIVDEAKGLVDDGVREITLLGQTVNSYGKRLAKRRQIGLHHVLYELSKIDDLDRISFITSHPRFMFPELIEAMGNLPKVSNYLHLPVQSGSNSVLTRMLRTYSVDEYRRVIDACREQIPDLGLATDIIVGFCGETDSEFEETLQLVEDLQLQGAFIFKYSEREGTRAAALYRDDVSEAIKKERHRRVQEVVERSARKVYGSRVGRTEEVLVEGLSQLDSERLTGRNHRHQIVVFPTNTDRAPATSGDKLAVGPNSASLVGRFVPVRITESTNVVLVGECVGPGR